MVLADAKLVRGSKFYMIAAQIDSGEITEGMGRIPKRMFDTGLVDSDNNLTQCGQVALFSSKHCISVLGTHMLAYSYQNHIGMFGEHNTDCPIIMAKIKAIGSTRHANRIKMIISQLIKQNFFIRHGYCNLVLNHKKIESLTHNETLMLSDLH